MKICKTRGAAGNCKPSGDITAGPRGQGSKSQIDLNQHHAADKIFFFFPALRLCFPHFSEKKKNQSLNFTPIIEKAGQTMHVEWQTVLMPKLTTNSEQQLLSILASNQAVFIRVVVFINCVLPLHP